MFGHVRAGLWSGVCSWRLRSSLLGYVVVLRQGGSRGWVCVGRAVDKGNIVNHLCLS